MASLPAPAPPVFHSGCNRVTVFVCSVGSMWFYLPAPHSHELQRHFGGREQGERSEEEGGNKLLRCKNSFMVDHAGIWAVPLLGHRSPVQPWPGSLVFFGPLAQADKDSCLCLEGSEGPSVRTIPCL